jgi:Mg-chelatase subunit ChlD
MGRRGNGRGLFFFIFLIAMPVIFLRSRGASVRADRDDHRPAAATDQGKYVPTGDEGLGAAVAIVLDNSGSMGKKAGSDARPKHVVAREAIREMLESTDSFVARQPGYPIKVGLFQFSGDVRQVVGIKEFDRDALNKGLASIPSPEGGTAIGEAMDAARAALYESHTIRKYILVVTDGENTDGRDPAEIAHEINRRSEGAVRLYFVAFDVKPELFSFVRDVRGELLSASNAVTLRASLDTIYRGRILAEAMDAGETLPVTKRDTTLPLPPRHQ